MRPRVAILAAFVVAVAAATPGSAAGDDWIGDSSGWRLVVPNEGGMYVEATTNGGRTWRVIFDLKDDIDDVVHTALRTGAVVTDSSLFWTTNNGGVWFVADVLNDSYDVEGGADTLFWASRNTLYELRPWPPNRENVSCASRVTREPGLNVCRDPKVPLRGHRVARARAQADVARLERAPGGVVAVFLSADRAPQAIVRRHGRTRASTLPRLRAETAAKVNIVFTRLFVEWPRVTVLAVGSAGGPVATWSSEDGGAHWELRTTP